MRVMGNIKDRPGSLADYLESPRQHRALYAVANRLLANLKPAGAQGRNRRSRIRHRNLRQRQVGQRPLPIVERPALFPGLVPPVNVTAQEPRPFFIRHLSNGQRHIRFTDDGRFAGAENTRLFAADAFAIRPQPVSMIEGDTGHHRHVGIDDIGRIQAAAQAHLKNHHIQPRLLKQPQRGKRAELKIAQGNLTARGFNFGKRGSVRQLRQLLALHAHPLGIAYQMRRTVNSNLVARRHQRRLQGTAGSAFTVGPRHREDKRRRF